MFINYIFYILILCLFVVGIDKIIIPTNYVLPKHLFTRRNNYFNMFPNNMFRNKEKESSEKGK